MVGDIAHALRGCKTLPESRTLVGEAPRHPVASAGKMLVPEAQRADAAPMLLDFLFLLGSALLLRKSPGAGAASYRCYHRCTNCRHCGKASGHTMLPLFLVLACLGQLTTADQGK